MSEAKAILRYVKISPRKMRLVAGLVRGLPVKAAEAELALSSKRACVPLLKLLRSAVVNAVNNNKLPETSLYIKELRVDEGPVIKRWTPRAKGSVAMIQKKMSHVLLVVDAKEGVRQPSFSVIKKDYSARAGKKKAKGESRASEQKNRKKQLSGTNKQKIKGDDKPEPEKKTKLFQRKSV